MKAEAEAGRCAERARLNKLSNWNTKQYEWRQADTTRKEQCKKKSTFQTNLEASVTTVWKERCGDERRKKPVLKAARVNE